MQDSKNSSNSKTLQFHPKYVQFHSHSRIKRNWTKFTGLLHDIISCLTSLHKRRETNWLNPRIKWKFVRVMPESVHFPNILWILNEVLFIYSKFQTFQWIQKLNKKKPNFSPKNTRDSAQYIKQNSLEKVLFPFIPLFFVIFSEYPFLFVICSNTIF